MSYTLQSNIAEFSKLLNDYLAASNRGIVETVNTKAFFIARSAIRFTAKASKAKILSEMGEVRKYKILPSKSKRSKKGYSVRTQRSFPPSSRVIAIVQSRRAKKGLPPLKRAKAKAEARKIVNAKTRAIGTLKAGWHGMLVRLKYLVKEKYSKSLRGITGGMRKVKGVGKASPANPRSLRNPTATLNYVMLSDRMSGVHQFAIRGANMAVSAERASMEKYMASKLLAIARAKGVSLTP